MAIIKMIIAYVMCLTQILAPVNVLLKTNEADYFTEWSETDVFDQGDYIELEKTAGKDFVILNLADVQLSDDEVYDNEGVYSEELIKQLVADHNPDLITLTGDNACGVIAYMQLIELLESFDIPWAPIMGNHEGDGLPSEFWAAYRLAEAENCLFECGPEDMGYGNYIINITENGKIIHTLFMMDTHSNNTFTLDDGTEVEGYDHLWENQQNWYKWAVNGIKDIAGKNVESTVMIHIPVYEIYDAWNQVSIPADDLEFGKVNPLLSSVASGRKYEESCPSAVNNGFFDLCKELGSTKTILAGHDHRNDFVVLYEGVRLAYAVKSGFGSYWREDMIGATTININSKGKAELTQNYYDLAEYGYNVEP